LLRRAGDREYILHSKNSDARTEKEKLWKNNEQRNQSIELDAMTAIITKSNESKKIGCDDCGQNCRRATMGRQHVISGAERGNQRPCCKRKKCDGWFGEKKSDVSSPVHIDTNDHQR
jgi:hypothetical protein